MNSKCLRCYLPKWNDKFKVISKNTSAELFIQILDQK